MTKKDDLALEKAIDAYKDALVPKTTAPAGGSVKHAPVRESQSLYPERVRVLRPS
jgi:hypothetical protein